MLSKSEQEIMQNWQGDISKSVVSICTITYNHENYISESIDSFLMQETDFPFEIVIGEDCSTDATRKIIATYLEKYPNIIKLITSENNVGMIPNFTRTIKACKGKYVALCEGDDYWTDEKKLQIQKDFLDKNEEYVICYTDVEAFNENGIIKSYRGGAKKDLTQDELKKATPINTLTVMFRNIIEVFPPEMNLSKYGDIFIWSLLSKYGEGKYIETIKPSMYRMHEGGVHSMMSMQTRYHNNFVTFFFNVSLFL